MSVHPPGFTDNDGVCTDCGRILSEPNRTFFGTMCTTCKNILIAEIDGEKD